MTIGLWRGTLLLLTGWLLSSGQIQAADYYIGVDGSGFSPAMLEINVGDTVVWENTDDTDYPHTTTSDLNIFDPGYWDGYMFSLGDTFSWTFNSVGTFTYHDSADIGTGTIIVNPLSLTPTITLESPRLENGQFLFEATGLTVGKTAVLMSSTNLTSWTAIQTNVADGSSLTFTNTTSLGHCFFQVVEQP